MKKVFGMVLVLMIMSSAVIILAGDSRSRNDRDDHKKSDYRHDSHRDYDRNDHRGDYRHHDRGGIITVTIVEPEPRGRWVDRVVGYQTVTREIYHPAIVRHVWDWSEFCFKTYTIRAWTEKVSHREPIVKRVWVSY